MSNPVVWFEVIGHDADKLRSFYRDLLGWSFQLDPVTKQGIVEPEAGSAGIAGRVGRAGFGQPSWMTIYTEVPDLEAAVRKAVELGSRVLMPITSVPAAAVAVVSDPEGHPVGLCQPR